MLNTSQLTAEQGPLCVYGQIHSSTASMAAAVANNIAGGRGPAYVLCALPYRTEAGREREDWGLDTALAIVEEAVEAFDPPRMQARPVKTSWPPELQDKAKVMDVVCVWFLLVTKVGPLVTEFGPDLPWAKSCSLASRPRAS